MSRRQLALCAALALQAVASASSPAQSVPLEIVFRTYDGPVASAGTPFVEHDVTLVAGTKEAKEFIDAHRRSNPELVAAYEKLTGDAKLRAHLGSILGLTGQKKQVILADDSRKYVDADKDGKPDTDAAAKEVTHVWPHSAGTHVVISQSYLESYPDEADLVSVLIHELSHTQDESNLYAGDYGADGSHFADEVLFNNGGKTYSHNAAWIEGWADFTPMLHDPAERADGVRKASKLTLESADAKHSELAWKNASYEQLLAVELTNAFILYDIATLLPGGKEKLFAAFRATNSDERVLLDVLAEYVRANPAEAFAVAAIFDAYTGFRAPDSALDQVLGARQAARYRRDFRDGLRKRNESGELDDVQTVTRHAASRLLEAGAEARLKAVRARLDELDRWTPSFWDVLGGPGWWLVKKLMHDRERARLLEERRQLEHTLASLRAARTEAALAVRILPPPPARPEEYVVGAGTGAGGEGSGAGVRSGTAAAAASVGSGTPAGVVSGQPLEWGR